MTEKLLGSTKTEIPKIKLALEPALKKAAEEAEAKRNVPPAESSLPKPTGWRIMVLPFNQKLKLKVEFYQQKQLQNDNRSERFVVQFQEWDQIVIEIKKDILRVRGAKQVNGLSLQDMLVHV